MSTIVALFPILFLIWIMTKKRPWPSHLALPFTAALVAIFQLFYFQAQLKLLFANAIAGILAVLTPISIIAGAILLNRVLVISGAENILREWLERISSNQVVQLMIIGWAFSFMLEGASGFGTPAAIAAPILVGLKFPAMQVVLLTLIMNSVPVSFGAVGTPTWFGFEMLQLSQSQILDVSYITAFIHLVAALFVPVIALRFLLPWRTIRRNLQFIYLSIFSCTIPYFLIALVNYEFPALIGGACGLLVTIIAAKKGVGLEREAKIESNSTTVSRYKVIRALSPFLLLIFILVVTRVEQLGIKPLLNDTGTWLSFGDFSLSYAAIVSWQAILGTTVSWSYKVLYVPAFIPFALVVILLIPILSLSRRQLVLSLQETAQRIRLPIISLVGALMMVNFMMQGGDESPIFIIANSLAILMGENWAYVASLLGALGAFFSGSATVSNLTFGSIQYAVADQTNLPIVLVLALQSVGAAMGNMICLNNIIAVSAILGIHNQEGAIIKRTIGPMLLYALIAALVGQFMLVFMP